MAGVYRAFNVPPDIQNENKLNCFFINKEIPEIVEQH